MKNLYEKKSFFPYLLLMIAMISCYKADDEMMNEHVVETIIFEADFEDGVPFVGQDQAHTGGGYISHLGGNVNGIPGNGTNDPTTHANVIRSNDTEGHGSVPGSEFSLKTHYAAGEQEPGKGFSNSFQKNTTIIQFPEVNSGEIHLSWSQKWSSSWQWPSDHQKMLKLKNSRNSQRPSQNMAKIQVNDQLSVGPATTVIGYGHPELPGGRNQVFANLFDWVPSSSVNVEDEINNELGSVNDDINFHPKVARWYSIEVMMKFDSSPGAADGEYKLWVDGDLYIHITNADIRAVGDAIGVDTAEFQHVREGREINNVDMPTYMDNIKIWKVE